jgi:type II secretory pathway predicted ATPase ExeA
MNNLAFKQFLADHDLSIRQFANYCRGAYVGKSTIFRLANPEYRHEVTPEYLIKIMPILIKGCQIFLEQQGTPADDIERILSTIFEEDYQPMISERFKLDTEHLDFFGLDRDPFALESDPRSAAEVYTNPALDRIVRRIEDAVRFQGFVAVIGQVGAGKTILKNRVADRLKKQGKAYLLWPRFAEMGKLNAGGILHYVLEEFGQRGRARLPLAQRQLERHLEQLNESGRPVALCIDECHRLNDSALTALKNFYELGTGGYEKYLGLVLLGQPSFKRRLEQVEFREIAERIEVIEMPSLAKNAADYLAHRLQLAGGSIGKLFDQQAVKAIASRAETPLAIGNLANKALISAYEKGEPRVLARFLEKDTEPKVTQIKKAANA